MKKIDAKNLFYTWDKKNNPVLEIESGEEICFETIDCFSESLEDTHSLSPTEKEVDTDLLNPLTGPVFIRGAKPADVLAITIKSIDFKPYAVVACRKQCGLLGSHFFTTTYKYVPIIDNKLIFDEKLSIPLAPMAGVIGVTPKIPISTRKMGDWGGNMDNNKITEGATLYLPVEVEGALLAVGDLHAAMGDGEMNGCALEAGGYLGVKVEVRKDLDFKRPAILDSTCFYTTATAKTAEEAMRYTCEDMYKFIEKRTALPPDIISMLMTSVGNNEVCVACAADSKTFRFSMPRYVLEAYGIKFI